MIEGVDVSHWQGVVPWQKVKDAGITFAWAKASGSGVTPLFKDGQYQRNRDEMRRLGIHGGAYHFYLGGVGTSAADQARHFYGCAGPSRPGDLRAALDLEDPPGGPLVLSRDDCRALVQTTADLFGYLPTIYCGESLFSRFSWLAAETAGCPLWLPNWSRVPTRPHAVHQFTDRRPVAGWQSVDGNRAASLTPVLVQPPAAEVLSESDRRLLAAFRSAAADTTRLLS